MKLKSILLLAVLGASVFLGRNSGAEPPVAVLQGDGAHPGAAHWIRSELYFGVGPAGPMEGGVGETRWRVFLDLEVTPRFPDGLTVFDAYGQWRGAGRTEPSRERSKVLVILHENTAEKRAAIDAIRAAWKALAHQQSVLLVSQPAEISF
jgi:hypothetical protein